MCSQGRGTGTSDFRSGGQEGLHLFSRDGMGPGNPRMYRLCLSVHQGPGDREGGSAVRTASLRSEGRSPGGS